MSGRSELERLARRIASGDLSAAAKAFAILSAVSPQVEEKPPVVSAGKGNVCWSGAGDFIVLVDASDEEGLVELPPPGGTPVGTTVHVKKLDASPHRVVAVGLGEPNEEDPQAHVGIQYEAMSLINDGKRWWMI